MARPETAQLDHGQQTGVEREDPADGVDAAQGRHPRADREIQHRLYIEAAADGRAAYRRAADTRVLARSRKQVPALNCPLATENWQLLLRLHRNPRLHRALTRFHHVLHGALAGASHVEEEVQEAIDQPESDAHSQSD